MNKNKRNIQCLNSGEVFSNTREISAFLNLSENLVIEVLRGRKEHVNGYKFIYIEAQDCESSSEA